MLACRRSLHTGEKKERAHCNRIVLSGPELKVKELQSIAYDSSSHRSQAVILKRDEMELDGLQRPHSCQYLVFYIYAAFALCIYIYMHKANAGACR